MFSKLNPAAGQPLYVQLMQQIRHAVETGVLRQGDALPGIRTLAEELVVSHNTVAKAYAELEHEGLLAVRHGAGAFVTAGRVSTARADQVRRATARVRAVVDALLDEGLTPDEIRRLVEAAVAAAATASPAAR